MAGAMYLAPGQQYYCCCCSSCKTCSLIPSASRNATALSFSFSRSKRVSVISY
jgi:hypothetical protein